MQTEKTEIDNDKEREIGVKELKRGLIHWSMLGKEEILICMWVNREDGAS